MSDSGRPALPDPQQDRHVAFPELTPEAADPSAGRGAGGGEDGGAASTGEAPGLPADAWADRSSPTGAPPSSTRQPDPVVLHTPPIRPEARSQRRRPAWLPYAAIIGIFLVLSNANSGDDLHLYPDGGYSSQEWGGSPDPMGNPPPDPAQVGWISSATDPATVKEPVSADTAVSAVPADTIVLRVEVTAPSPEDVLTQISTGAGLYEEIPESTPVLREVHTGPASRSLDVTVSSATESSAELQCRVYAGETLVALDTSTTGTVACTVAW